MPCRFCGVTVLSTSWLRALVSLASSGIPWNLGGLDLDCLCHITWRGPIRILRTLFGMPGGVMFRFTYVGGKVFGRSDA